MVNRIFNLHFTDFCNFSCRFCFAKNEKRALSLDEVRTVVDNIDGYFRENGVTDGKINIAGGEPTTCRYLQEIIDYIVGKGITATLITNGFILTEQFIAANRGKLQTIGLSIDSISPKTNAALGRSIRRRSETLEYERLTRICRAIRENGIRLKINTVVSRLNIHEDILPLLREVRPDRIKFLQMLPVNAFAESLVVSDSEFEEYLQKYREFDYVAEYSSDIAGAYMIIDSGGFVSTNNLHLDKKYSALRMPIRDIVSNVDFNFEGEMKRYQ
ncbi:viperin family antiviral radical SAM protein [Sutterella sp.]|uniref:viperin family antiviral radical SAM protein n=1 Tax=Sutterella sp. TaxID=1981025 RepID=UPI0026E01EA8|nr:viperin family antiviral radical SAM protein [Sutterella sp.]MDO5531996.1 viperin family antiviral radical SAM protein [Sutterella sp.]